ncbi:MAG: sulfate permease, SulP family [Cyanobacteriota bacterium erpe_2018_sw_39hr_WHONDRS-SW48-000098_B_bin.30]|jgi:SulP family sulfate permease|nr:sulfate permease, SulP family [Cyanobacteriota bacterium erpe_2018_sw_39hr_WHONDRS-SW48-000098_B_bin.30]
MTSSLNQSRQDRVFDFNYLMQEWTAMFNPQTMPRDLLSGITVAMVALPLNLALAIAAGVEPAMGFCTGIVAGVIAALFGGQRYAVTGPAAAMAVVLIEVAHTYGLPGIWFVGLVAGILQLIAGLLRLGRIITYIPMPVIVGFANAIGILVFFNALDDFLGLPGKPLAHPTEGAHVLGTVPFIPEFINDISDIFNRALLHGEVNYQAILIGVLVILIAIYTPKVTKVIPGQLVAIVLTSMLAYFMHFDVARIINVAPIPALNLIPHLPSLPIIQNTNQLQSLLLYGITVFMLGSIESLLSASVADGMTMSSKHRADQELCGQGLANIAMPFFGGIPVTGVIARTAVNISAGAKTRLSAIVHSLVLLGMGFTLAPMAEQIPLAALAGILVLTGFRLIEWDAIREIWRGSKTEGWVVIVTTVASVAIDLTAGVLTGLMLTCVLFVRQMSSVRMVVEGDDSDDRLSAGQLIPSCKFARTYLVDGPLFFGAVQKFTETILITQDLKALILHMRAVTILDMTGVETLLSIHSQLRRKNVRMVIAELPGQPLELLKNTGALKVIGAENYFYDYKEALLDVNERLLTTECQSCSYGLGLNKTAKNDGPKDCRLRSALLMDNNRLTRILKSRMDRTQKMKTGQFEAIKRDITRLVPIKEESDIPESLRNTPIETLLKCQNMGQIDATASDKPELIIAMCIDYRKSLSLPQNCAYVIRREGANMAGSEFSLALALSAGIDYIALIAHNHCIMSNPNQQREAFINVMAGKRGWTDAEAKGFFDKHASSREISDAIDFSVKESRRLSRLFSGVKIVPMMFMLEDNMLYLVKDWVADEVEGKDILSIDEEDVEAESVGNAT